MRSRNVTIWVMLGVLLLGCPRLLGTVEFKDGQTHDIGYTIYDDVWVDWQAPGMETTVNWLNYARLRPPYKLQAFEDSRINVYGGLIVYLYAHNTSQVRVSMVGGGINHLRAYDNSQVSMSRGRIDRGLHAHDRTQVSISGGSISDLRAYGSSQVTISGGGIRYDLLARDSSRISMSGGWIYEGLYCYDSSRVTMSGGSIEYLRAYNSSQVTVSGGSIRDWLRAYNSSQITMSGGSVGGQLIADDDGILTIQGSDFAVDEMPFGYGELTSILGGHWYDEPKRHLTGVLASGDLLDNDFYIGHSAKIVLVPEPATLLLLGLGAVMVRRKR